MTDDELISAYVDGRLSEAERATFEARMARDLALRRRTVATRLLVREARALPSRQPPRNFILPPDIGQKRDSAESRRPAFSPWVFRMGALAATIVFVSLVALELLQPIGTPASLEVVPASAELMAQGESPTAVTPAARMAPMGVVPEQGESQPADSMQAAAAPEAVEAVPLQALDEQMVTVPALAPQPPRLLEGGLVTPTRLAAAAALLVAVILGLLGWVRR